MSELPKPNVKVSISSIKFPSTNNYNAFPEFLSKFEKYLTQNNMEINSQMNNINLDPREIPQAYIEATYKKNKEYVNMHIELKESEPRKENNTIVDIVLDLKIDEFQGDKTLLQSSEIINIMLNYNN